MLLCCNVRPGIDIEMDPLAREVCRRAISSQKTTFVGSLAYASILRSEDRYWASVPVSTRQHQTTNTLVHEFLMIPIADV